MWNVRFIKEVFDVFNILGVKKSPDPEAYVTMQYNMDNPTLAFVSSYGEVKVESIYQGEPRIGTYASLFGSLSIMSDANTEIKLIGIFSMITSIDGDIGLTSLNIQGETKLTNLAVKGTSLTNLNLQDVTKLYLLDIRDCTGLTTLDLRSNPDLSLLYCVGCTNLTTILCHANNNYVSTQIAYAITNANANNGTVYVASADEYYSIISDAATAKGWTVLEPN